RHGRAQTANGLQWSHAVQSWHGQDQAKLGSMLMEQGSRLSACAGTDHAVAIFTKARGQYFAHGPVVFEQQNPFAAAAGQGTGSCRLGQRAARLSARKIDFKRGPDTQPALDVDKPTVVFNYARDGGEPQRGPL